MNLKKASLFLSKCCFFNSLTTKAPLLNHAACPKTTIKKPELPIMQTPVRQQGPQAATDTTTHLPYLSLDDLAALKPLTLKASSEESQSTTNHKSTLKF